MPREVDIGQSAYAVGAVEHAMGVVAALMRTGPATLSDLAAEAGCTRVTTFRALHTLRSWGLVMQEGPRGRWRLGAGWLGIARAANNQHALAHAAAATLQALAAACQETVQLTVRDGQESQLVAVYHGNAEPAPIRPDDARAPLHAGPGRLLLAHAPGDVQRNVLASRLPRLTGATRIDPAWIAADLPRIRLRGWLIATNEVQDGMVTVSHGVRDPTGEVFAVVTIVAPSGRMRAPRPHTLLTPLMATAAALEAALAMPRARR